MNVAIQIPIKGRSSTRVPNKNFRELAGKPFSFWLLDELVAHCPPTWDIFVDTEDVSKFDSFRDRYGERLQFHQRDAWFAGDSANGNHLLTQFAVKRPEYDIYLQAFVTAVTLSGSMFMEACNAFIENIGEYDSMFLVTEENGWVWYQGEAINYDPTRADGLPRSQDACYLKETTGLYAITREAQFKTACRVGHKPLLYKVEQRYAFDVDTMEDFRAAESLLSAPSS